MEVLGNIKKNRVGTAWKGGNYFEKEKWKSCLFFSCPLCLASFKTSAIWTASSSEHLTSNYDLLKTLTEMCFNTAHALLRWQANQHLLTKSSKLAPEKSLASRSTSSTAAINRTASILPEIIASMIGTLQYLLLAFNWIPGTASSLLRMATLPVEQAQCKAVTLALLAKFTSMPST